MEEFKQRVVYIAAKDRRYQARLDRFRQNSIFQNNQRQIYRELNQEGERSDDDQPNAEESKIFCGNIWGVLVDHTRSAKLLQNLESEET